MLLFLSSSFRVKFYRGEMGRKTFLCLHIYVIRLYESDKTISSLYSIYLCSICMMAFDEQRESPNTQKRGKQMSHTGDTHNLSFSRHSNLFLLFWERDYYYIHSPYILYTWLLLFYFGFVIYLDIFFFLSMMTMII